MSEIKGGRWHVGCEHNAATGYSLQYSYRTNIWGNIVEYGDSQTD